MGIRLPSIPFTKNTLLVAAQLVVNVGLAAWLYDEYLHNPYMQAYLSNAWSAVWPIIAVVVGIAVGASGVFVVYTRRSGATVSETVSSSAAGSLDNLEMINDCPFCNLPLKTISEGRLQCRNCRRYFKSSMPKTAIVSA